MELQQSDQLRNWTASLATQTPAEETNGKFKFLTKPEFKCIMCKKEITSSPVFQCQLGHLASSRCSCRGKNCILCNKAISRIKNVAIGAIIDALYVTCKYETLGCKKTYQFKSYNDHEKTCPFAPMSCPMPDCKQAGVTNSLEQHLKSKHNISALVDGELPIPKQEEYYPYPGSASLNLNSSTTKVLLRHSGTNAKDFYLLHQVITEFGDSLHVSSPTDSCNLKT